MKSLSQLAVQFNDSVKSNRAHYIELGCLLIAMRKIVNGDKRSPRFREWCKVNLRKIDGKPFSYKTLENYIYLASDPNRVARQKKMQRKNIRSIRLRANGIETADVVAQLYTKKISVPAQVNIMMVAWESSCEVAQEQFLNQIGARI